MTTVEWSRAVTLSAPQWLWLLTGLPLAAAALWRSRRTDARGRRTAHVALRALIIAALSLAAARPVLRDRSAAMSVVVMVDASASIDSQSRAQQQRAINELIAAAAKTTPPTLVRTLAFAAEPHLLGDGATFPAVESGETDLAHAFGLALGVLDKNRIGRLVLLSDGRATKGATDDALERVITRKVPLFVQPTAAGDLPARAIVDMTAPAQVEPRAPFTITTRVHATRAESVRMKLERLNAPTEKAVERQVLLNRGHTDVTWPARLDDTTPAVFRAAFVQNDEEPRNDSAQLLLRPRARPEVLIIEGQPHASASFAAALRAEAMNVTIRPVRAFPAQALPAYDLVVLADLPRAGLAAPSVRALDDYVRAGGGVFLAAGPLTSASRGHDGTPLGALLPLQQDNTAVEQEPTLALALVIDRSGSMSGPKIDLTKEAARGTAALMAPQDLISVVVFDTTPQTVVRLQPAANRQRILSDIAQIRASGGTDILAALREAIEPLTAASARKKHLILLSDGQSPTEGLEDVVDDAVAAHITISAVGVGEGADVAVLQAIATRGGGRFYQTRDPASIPRIFSRETSQLTHPPDSNREVPLRLKKPSELFAGINIDAAPPLLGRTRMRAKPGSELLLATVDEAPLLARWRVGLGHVLVFASSLSGQWSAGLARWPSAPKFWGQIARGSLRRGQAAGLHVEARRLGDRVVATVRVQRDGAERDSGLTGNVELLTLDRAMKTVARTPLHETSPGRYTADLPDPRGRALLVHASLNAENDTPLTGDTRLAGTAPPEFLPTPGAEAALLRLAARTGGGRFDAPVVLNPGSDRAQIERSLQPHALLVALVVFLLDLCLRRVTLRASKSTGRGAAW